jgi:outer membrane protein assembly factor BamB
MRVRLIAVVVLLLGWSVVRAEDWPCWRGPRLDGTSQEVGVPLKWSQTENIVWKTPIPGKGHSSPIIWGDRIFVTSCVESDEQRLLLCLDRRDGKVIWQREVVRAKLEHKHGENSFASSTPCTDGKHVWVSFLQYPDMQVVCFDYDGKEIWRRSPGKLLSVHGFCTSPILHKNLVILNGDQDARKDGQAYIVALDKNTGEERWRIDRPNKTRSYCTPILVESPKHPGVTQLVLSGSKSVTSYDADTGNPVWFIKGPTEQYVASLVYLDHTLFLSTGFPEYHLMGINPDGEGDITKSEFIRWHIPHKENGNRGASYVPSPIAYHGHFYVVSDVGYLSCLEADTGKRVWMEKLGRHHHASLVLIEGHIVIPDDDGNCYVLKAGPKFEVVHKNVLGEEAYASPAVSRGQLFIRTAGHLWCIGKTEKSETSSGK